VSIYRRGVLKVAGTSLVAVALDVSGVDGPAGAVTRAAAATPVLTALDRTVRLDLPGGVSRYTANCPAST